MMCPTWWRLGSVPPQDDKSVEPPRLSPDNFAGSVFEQPFGGDPGDLGELIEFFDAGPPENLVAVCRGQ